MFACWVHGQIHGGGRKVGERDLEKTVKHADSVTFLFPSRNSLQIQDPNISLTYVDGRGQALAQQYG